MGEETHGSLAFLGVWMVLIFHVFLRSPLYLYFWVADLLLSPPVIFTHVLFLPLSLSKYPSVAGFSLSLSSRPPLLIEVSFFNA